MHCVDLGESFPTSIYLQKSASIQPRTSPSKFGGKFNSIFIRLLGEEGQGRKGVTIMLRDVPYTMRVEPHVFDLLRNTSDLSHVDYIYLPMTTNHGSDSLRNKGYCFIHFSNNDSAQRFVSRLEHYVLPRSMFPSAALFNRPGGWGGGSEAGRQPNFGGLVLGCIDADFCK